MRTFLKSKERPFDRSDEFNKKSTALCAVDFYQWCQLESNQRHMDFQSIALPTELWHPEIGRQK
jgi:hypothetical protein